MPIEMPETGLTTHFIGTELDPAVVDEIAARGVEVVLDDHVRADHGRDWWPLSIGWVAAGEVPAMCGAVVHARSVEDVVATLEVANANHVPVTVQGGRSGVVGGAVPQTGGLALDLTGLSEVLEIDEVGLTVRVQAGCFGPDLEAALGERGLTAGHFPQSFDLATVGGWLACRGAGQYSNRFGKIEDIVRGLTVVLADGRVVTTGGRGPRQSVGPDLTQLFVGSEGTLGVIVEATLALRPRAAYEERLAVSFDTFADGLEACRRILRRGSSPAVLRLYDHAESTRNFEVDRACLIVLDEGEPGAVSAAMEIVAEECDAARREDVSLVEKWLGHRNDVSALAPLWQRGIVVDTIEVAGPWSRLETIHQRVTDALLGVEGTAVATCHQSHAYVDGACLYFTFAGRAPSDAEAYYRAAWDAASTATLASGGALSHHHGVGRNRARFVREALGSGFEILEAMKTALDPHGILNPGVLALAGRPW
jgi:alkyldihydroxyacetonephosphate synthase